MRFCLSTVMERDSFYGAIFYWQQAEDFKCTIRFPLIMVFAVSIFIIENTTTEYNVLNYCVQALGFWFEGVRIC